MIVACKSKNRCESKMNITAQIPHDMKNKCTRMRPVHMERHKWRQLEIKHLSCYTNPYAFLAGSTNLTANYPFSLHIHRFQQKLLYLLKKLNNWLNTIGTLSNAKSLIW